MHRDGIGTVRELDFRELFALGELAVAMDTHFTSNVEWRKCLAR